VKIDYCDALVIGGGLAGLRVAVATQEKNLSTIVLSLVPVKRSHSVAAQGGMQASLANSVWVDVIMRMYTLLIPLRERLGLRPRGC